VEVFSDRSTNSQRRSAVIGRVGHCRFGPFRLDAHQRFLTRDGQPIHLKPKEWDLLDYLIEHRGRLVTKDELTEALWPRQSIPDANLTQTVYAVRRALADSARNPRWIATVSRLGYRFVGEVRHDEAGHGTVGPKSIAVLPFSGGEASGARAFDASEGPSDRSLDLADAMIRVLSADRSLHVRPLSAGLDSSGSEALEAGRRLKVDAVIEGSIVEKNGAVRVVCSLVETSSGELLWSRGWTLDGHAANVWRLRIAEAVHAKLRSGIDRDAHPAARRLDFDVPEARAAYLRGRYCWQQFTEPGFRRAIELFDDALERLPSYADAWAWRAAAWAALGNIGAVSPRESAELARRDADRAIGHDEGLSSGFESRGAIELYFDWNLDAALRSFDRAIERDPHSSNAHHLRGNALAFGGIFRQAICSLEHAERLDPTSLITATDIGFVRYLAGDYDRALSCLETVLAQNEHFAHARLKFAYVLSVMGRHQEALVEVDRVVGDSRPSRLPERALFLGRAGRTNAAAAWLEAAAGDADADALDSHALAVGYMGIDDRDRVFAHLASAMDFRSRQLVQLALDPLWLPIRSDPRFRALAAAIGLAEVPDS